MTITNVEFPQCVLTLRGGKIIGAPADGSDSQKWILVLQGEEYRWQGIIWNESAGVVLGWDDEKETVIPSTTPYTWEVIIDRDANQVGFRVPKPPREYWHHALQAGDETNIGLNYQSGLLKPAQMWTVT